MMRPNWTLVVGLRARRDKTSHFLIEKKSEREILCLKECFGFVFFENEKKYFNFGQEIDKN